MCNRKLWPDGERCFISLSKPRTTTLYIKRRHNSTSYTGSHRLYRQCIYIYIYDNFNMKMYIVLIFINKPRYSLYLNIIILQWKLRRNLEWNNICPPTFWKTLEYYLKLCNCKSKQVHLCPTILRIYAVLGLVDSLVWWTVHETILYKKKCTDKLKTGRGPYINEIKTLP